MKTTAIGKRFLQKWIKSRKIFSAYQYQNFGKFQHQTSAMEKNNLSKEKKKSDSKEIFPMNFSSSRPEVYC